MDRRINIIGTQSDAYGFVDTGSKIFENILILKIIRVKLRLFPVPSNFLYLECLLHLHYFYCYSLFCLVPFTLVYLTISCLTMSSLSLDVLTQFSALSTLILSYFTLRHGFHFCIITLPSYCSPRFYNFVYFYPTIVNPSFTSPSLFDPGDFYPHF